MAAEDEAVSDYIEGFNASGKGLERITQGGALHDLHQKTNKARNDVDVILASEMDELQKLQHKLNNVNEDYLKKTSELEGMKRKQEVALDNSRQTQLSEVMRGTLENYVERRPVDPNDKRSVHVYFLTGEDELGSELHVGREGAGSRDATFIVTLSQTVQSLATQAAKYWGLNPEKVFFLDRDGRIVQGKMSLSDIILPPEQADKEASGSAEGSAAALPGGAASSTALALPGSAAKKGAADDQNASYTVKGRDYGLTLVRAKTVLTKEDLSQPKGEKWNDFTFDQKKLNEDLEMTRKKRGDPDPQEMKVSMDTIPSLYDLIEKGNQRKFQKNVDKWCRIIELIAFLIMWVAFMLLLKPDSGWSLTMNYAAQAIRHDITSFTLTEQTHLGIHNYSEIHEAYQLAAWVHGPLRRSVLAGGLDRRNAYPLKVQGRLYRRPLKAPLDLNWCTDSNSSGDNDTNTSNGTLLDADAATCYPSELKPCHTEGVVKLMAYAASIGQSVPKCRKQYDRNPTLTALHSLYAVDAFSFTSGEMSSYLAGDVIEFNLTSWADFNVSVAPFLAHDASTDPPAKLVNVVTYLPALEGMHVSQWLTEYSPGGPLMTNYKSEAITLDPADEWEVIVYQVCILLALTCLLLELRRITGWPQRYFYEGQENKDSCGPCTVLFVFVPVLLLLNFWILIRKTNVTFDIRHLSDHTATESSNQYLESIFPAWIAKPEPYQWTHSEKTMFDLQLVKYFGYAGMCVNLFNFTLMMLLSFRFFLVYFPEMRYITLMIRRVTKPVIVSLSLLVISMLAFATVFYIVFSDHHHQFRNWLVTFMSVLQFAHGGFMHWEGLYEDYAWTWYFLMVAAFLVFTLNLNNILIAVMVSHKKEAELHKNYSSHPFWQTLHRTLMQQGKKGELNPALAGWDFGDPLYKDGPQEVTGKPGLEI